LTKALTPFQKLWVVFGRKIMKKHFIYSKFPKELITKTIRITVSCVIFRITKLSDKRKLS